MVDIPGTSELAVAHTPDYAVRDRTPRARSRPVGTGRRLRVAAALALGDLFAAAGVSLLIIALEMLWTKPPTTETPVEKIAASALLLILIHLALGLYDGRCSSPVERFRLRTLGGMVFAAVITATLVLERMPLGAAVLLPVLAGVVITGHGFEALIRGALIRRGVWGAPTAIVGCGALACDLTKMLGDHPELGLRPVGFLVDRTLREHTDDELPLPIIGTVESAEHIGEAIEVALFASPEALPDSIERANRLHCPHIILVQNASDMQSLWVQTRPLGTAIGLEMRRDLLLPHNLLIKRILDLAIALPLAVIALPVIAMLALAITLVDPGGAIYRQRRVGRHGNPIQVLKLRTMYSDADSRLLDILQTNPGAAAEWEQYLKLSNDPRILPIVGRFLRRTSLDELPQLWNIVRGDMSLVGPRPFPSYHNERFDSDFQALRTSVTPGLTGLWQVSSRSNGDLAVQKAEDSFYIMNWSIWLDLYVLLQTVPAVMSAKGAR